MKLEWHSKHLLSYQEDGDFGEVSSEDNFDDQTAELEASFGKSQARSVVFTLQSWQCFATTLDPETSKLLRKRSMLAFELEDSLPFDADSLAISRQSTKNHELIIAADSAQLLRITQAAEETGVYIRCISPLILLAVDALQKVYPGFGEVDLLLHADDRGIDAVWLSSGIPYRWEWLPLDDTARVHDAIERIEAECPVVMASGLASRLPEASDDSFVLQTYDFDAVELACKQAESVTNGYAAPTFDLREGPLAAKDPHFPIALPLKLAAGTLILLQIAILAFLHLRGTQYQSMAEESSSATVTAFEETFPSERVPVGVLSRMESEHRRLRGTRGLSDQTPRIPSIIPALHAFLNALPSREEARFRFSRVEVSPDELTSAVGVAKSFEDQQAVLEAMRR
ncbi:MAG: hypothetical protein AAFV88_24340, partial [Planctomycetota bacterium]